MAMAVLGYLEDANDRFFAVMCSLCRRSVWLILKERSIDSGLFFWGGRSTRHVPTKRVPKMGPVWCVFGLNASLGT